MVGHHVFQVGLVESVSVQLRETILCGLVLRAQIGRQGHTLLGSKLLQLVVSFGVVVDSKTSIGLIFSRLSLVEAQFTCAWRAENERLPISLSNTIREQWPVKRVGPISRAM